MVGVSIEEVGNVASQLGAGVGVGVGGGVGAGAGVGGGAGKGRVETVVLARRIIQDAFNFLSSFSGGGGGEEMVPLRVFNDWWVKFEKKVELDPGFLERED